MKTKQNIMELTIPSLMRAQDLKSLDYQLWGYCTFSLQSRGIGFKDSIKSRH